MPIPNILIKELLFKKGFDLFQGVNDVFLIINL